MADAAAPSGHRGTRAIERMVEFAPGTGGLALWMGHRDLDAGDPDAPAALLLTDGTTLLYRPAFADLGLDEQTGRVAHAVLHVALRHVQRLAALQARTGDADPELFNTCADAIVNSALGHLGWLSLPPGAIRLEQLLLEVLAVAPDPVRALLEWDVERLYRAIDDRRPAGGRDASNRGSNRDGPRAARVRALGAGTPPDLLPQAVAQEAPEEQVAAAREWAERMLRAHAGDGEHSMLRALLADLHRPRTPWEQVLRTRLARSLATRPEPSWSRPSRSWIANQGRGGPNRRMPWEPGLTGTRRVPRLAVIVDVSGSVDDALMARFAREVEAITRRTESGLVLIVGDDRVRRVERFAPGRSTLREVTFHGGGGTDFTPLLEEATAHDPDIAVVLTDLQGPARHRPRCPVLWAVPREHAAAVAPFGRTVVLD